MCYIPDALDMWEAHEVEKEAELQKQPECEYCNEFIQDDYLYDIEGMIICEHCLNKYFRKHTEDYVE